MRQSPAHRFAHRSFAIALGLSLACSKPAPPAQRSEAPPPAKPPVTAVEADVGQARGQELDAGVPAAPEPATPTHAEAWSRAAVVTTAGGYTLQLFDDTVSETTPNALALRVGVPKGTGRFALEVALLDPTDAVKGQRRIEGDLAAGDLTAPLGFGLGTSEYPLYRLRVTAERTVTNPGGGDTTESSAPETFGLMRFRGLMGLEVLAPKQLLAGGPAAVRIVARNLADHAPVSGAEVQLRLDGRTLATANTDENGTIDATMMVPDDAKDGTLSVVVKTETTGASAEAPVTIRHDRRILLSSDKPLYQPGQTIHVRALAMKRPANVPVAGEQAVIEVTDPKGNKVFRSRMPTTPQGVAFADFQLASEVILGTYRVGLTIGDATAERTIEIKRYTLPKFKVAVTPDKAFYKPGDSIEGSIDARYFFGKSVAGKVTVALETFDVGWSQAATAEGVLDPNGRWSFTVALPATLVGQPLADWKAMAKLTATVTDSAGQDETGSAQVPVAPAPARVDIVVAGQRIVAGATNEVFVIVTTPDGRPIPGAKVAVAYGGATTEGKTGETGLATVLIEGKTASPDLSFTTTLPSGDVVLGNVTVAAENGPAVTIRPDKVALAVGDTFTATVEATGGLDRVFVDVIRDGQALLTKTVVLASGRGTVSIPLSTDHVGTLLVQAYSIGKDMTVVRDARPILVTNATELSVSLDKVDGGTYKPGDEAKLTLSVADGAGKAAPNAALGIAIVDEALFALADANPGLLKLFFALEKELITPKLEVHALDVERIGDGERREETVRVLGAAAGASWEAGTVIDTLRTVRGAVAEAFLPKVKADAAVVQATWIDLSGAGKVSNFQQKLEEKLKKPLRDAWGKTYRIDVTGQGDMVTAFTLRSAGPDDAFDTDDDLTYSSAQLTEERERETRKFEKDMMRFEGAGIGGGGRGDGIMPAPAAMAAQERPEMREVPADLVTAAPGGAPVRVRQYFPETLYVNPLVLTGDDGKATVSVTMADSITTWRLTATASDAQGRIGSGSDGVVVFQDFFVDLDVPESLTRGDEVTVPVAVYNYADGEQTVTLEVDVGEAFELVGQPGALSLTLAKGEVRGTQFRVRAKAVGRQPLTVTAKGTRLADAVRRDIRVVPDGVEQVQTESGTLDGKKSFTVEFPARAIPGANALFVKAYPGSFSQVVEGLDAIFQMPSGCFEQTTSTTYPNILALDYLRENKKATPEVEAKAISYINQGWQRLLTFEVEGGGFSWFGDAPANKILTAFGIQEFSDMARVFEIDPAVQARSQAWLAAQQEPDGSWKPDASFLHAENWSDIQKGSLLVTAYIARALALTVPDGKQGDDPAIGKAIGWLKEHRKEAVDAYSLALIGGALAKAAPSDPVTAEVLSTLAELGKRSDDGKTIMWDAGVRTAVYGNGLTANIETTALATLAFMTAKREMDLVKPALTWLVAQKDAQGTWHATMPTVLALSALVRAITGSQDTVSGTVAISLDGEPAGEWKITPEDSDLVRLLDLGTKATAGKHTVELSMSGQGAPAFQVVSRHYLPEGGKAEPKVAEAFTMTVTYDKTALTTADIVTATATVTNALPVGAQMMVLDLAAPPGFDVMAEDFDTLVSGEKIKKYSLAARQILVYLDHLDAGTTIELRYRLKARVALKAQSGESHVYAYYEPSQRGRAKPTAMVVTE